MNKELKEKIAVNAANEWCRCFKCDGSVNATGRACDKDKKLTCHKWYDGYRTALLAIYDYKRQMIKEVDIDKLCKFRENIGFAYPEGANEYQKQLVCYWQGIKDVIKALKGE